MTVDVRQRNRKPLTKKEREIYNILLDNEPLATNEVAAIVQQPATGVRNVLYRLRMAGLVTRKPQRKWGPIRDVDPRYITNLTIMNLKPKYTREDLSKRYPNHKILGEDVEYDETITAQRIYKAVQHLFKLAPRS